MEDGDAGAAEAIESHDQPTDPGVLCEDRPVRASGGVLPRGIVTFLFTDVASSTAAWEADPGSMAAEMRRHDEVIERAVRDHGGAWAIEQGAGDSTVLAFERATDAVAAALAIQAGLADRADEGAPIEVRLAIHTGEVEVGPDGRYAGQTMNRCGRLLAAAHGGQAVVSGATADLVADALPDDVELHDLGSHRFRDVRRPVQVFQLDRRGAHRRFPPLRAVEDHPHNLPAALTSFIGRAEQRRALAELTEQQRLVTLTGSGGCGKTRLAITVAGDALDRFPGGAWFVDLAPVGRDEEVVEALVGALGLRARPGRAALDVAVEQLGAAEALVVLDNCEHVLDAAAELAATLLEQVPTLHLLATSREPLGLHGESTWRIPSLALPDPQVPGAESEATTLFVERARHARPAFTPTGADLAAIVRICERLDGIPLAIELAAARMRVLSAPDIEAELDDRFRLLTGGGRNLLPRQRTLEASVAWSYDLLAPAEQEALRRLAVFAGGFDRLAATQVLADSKRTDDEAADLVVRLVDKSLIATTDHRGGVRCSMLETVRHFAGSRLVDVDEIRDARDRHLAWAASLAERLAPRLEGPGVVEALLALDVEAENLDAALSWADASGDHHRFVTTMWSLQRWFTWRGHGRRFAAWAERTRAILDDLDERDRAFALGYLAHEREVADDIAGLDAAQAAWLEAATQLGDPWLVGRAMAADASLSWWGYRPLSGWDELQGAAAQCRAAGDTFTELWVGMGLAVAATFAGYDRRALDVVAEIERPIRELASPALLADVLGVAAHASANLGRLDEARRMADEALAHFEPVSDLTSTFLPVAVHTAIGLCTGNASAWRSTVKSLGRAYERDGELRFLPFVLLTLARLDLDAGEWAKAERKADAMLAHPSVTEMSFYRLQFLEVRAIATWQAGDPAAGRAQLESLVAEAHDVGHPRQEALAHLALAAIDRELGSHAAARDRCHDALTTFAELGCSLDVAAALRELAGIHLDEGSPERAATLHGAADAITTPVGAVHRTVRQTAYDADLAATRDLLGADAFDAARAAGAAMGIDEAVAYAHRARGERRRPTFGPESLTPTEQRVADLASEGLSNPAIAQELLMGRETVKTHLASIYRKLGITNRTELARGWPAATPSDRS
ncbi:MAG: LuxR C-terminal-related transcriptional regulator [Acidimicrobiales bacterium]